MISITVGRRSPRPLISGQSSFPTPWSTDYDRKQDGCHLLLSPLRRCPCLPPTGYSLFVSLAYSTTTSSVVTIFPGGGDGGNSTRSGNDLSFLFVLISFPGTEEDGADNDPSAPPIAVPGRSPPAKANTLSPLNRLSPLHLQPKLPPPNDDCVR